MIRDALLSMLHWWAVLGLFSALIGELMLVRGPLAPPVVRRLARLDAAYGGLFVLALTAGLLRAVYGAKGWEFYSGNPMFWTKIATLAFIGLLSLPPTFAFLRWKREARAGATIDAARVTAIRRWVHAELGVLFVVPAFAALMARGIGLG
ncbi:MAG: DUF2214 family protein [Burkholderiaceae bacterium]